METRRSDTVLGSFERLLSVGTMAGLTDGQLLERFAARRDDAAEAAFTALVDRHGPMVLRVCRQWLDVHGAADDAFQATFLVLARRAGMVRDPDRLAPWLHGVAVRVAREAKVREERRIRREAQVGAAHAVTTGAADTSAPTDIALARREEAQVLHEELTRLPHKYREPVILCALEGLTHQEVARRLRCPVGTVSVRLSRARERLRDRLTRRGLAPASGLVGTLFGTAAEAAAPEPVPGVLLDTTVGSALGRTGTAGSAAAALAHAAINTLALNRWRIPTLLVAAFGLAAGASFALTRVVGPPPIPGEVTLKLEPRTSIGGIVVDEGGKPIAGATVYLITTSRDRTRHDLLHEPCPTDAQGRWQCDRARAEFGQIQVRIVHPDFASDPTYNINPDPTLAEFRAGTAVLRLSRGVSIAGRVLDDNGQPIAGAKVAQGADRRLQKDYPATTTDADGRFRFEHARPGAMVLTATASAHAPEMTTVTVRDATEPVELRLGPGRAIRGRLVDPRGRPVAGAGIQVVEWRNKRTLEWEAATDADGRFRWDDAPADTVTLSIHHPAFVRLSQRQFTAGETESLITLNPPVRVHGKVVDAETGMAIPRVTLIPGYYRFGLDPDRGQVHWSRDAVRSFVGGRYDQEFVMSHTAAYSFRIEADGYVPEISRVFRLDEGEQVYDVKLRRGQGPVGLVRAPDGSALAGALVALKIKSSTAWITDAQTDPRSFPTVTTDAQGRFRFAPQAERFIVAVAHDLGYAERTDQQLAGSPEITLAPWGRIEGVARAGNTPDRRATMGLETPRSWPMDSPGTMTQGERTQPDPSGHYVFARVIPGEVSVYRSYTRTDSINLRGESTLPAHLEPGATLRLDFGGSGRAVVGRVIADARVDWTNSTCVLTLQRPPIPFPAQLDQAGRAAWYKKWSASPAAEDYRRKTPRYFPNTAPDGTFRADDIPAGTYLLRIDARGSSRNPIGSVIRTVAVREGGDEAPVDIGVLTLGPLRSEHDGRSDAVPRLAGKAAPLFQARTVDGREFRISNYRGRYVLLDFWATWCGPCVKERPALKAIHERFGGDARFVLVSLSLDREPGVPRAFANEHGLRWPQVFLGPGSETTVPDEYGAERIPAVYLINPDGRVIAEDLHGEEIAAAVAKALQGR